MKIDGSCHCGSTTYDAEVDPDSVVIYVKTADSGNKLVHAFCPECGTQLYSTALESPRFFMLRLGAVKQRAQLVPKKQGFCRLAMPWAKDIRGIPEV